MADFDDTINAVALSVQAQVPVLLVGEPGVAKTALVNAIFDQLCDEQHTSIVALHEPPEYGGFPVPQDANGDAPARVALLPNDWVVRLGRAKRRAGLFLDELSNGAPATRSAAMRGVHERVWGDTEIPRLATVAAMNPANIAESGYDLSAPLANRFVHVEWVMPATYWVDKLVAGFPTPRVLQLREAWRDAIPEATTYVAAFGNARPNVLQAMPESAAKRSGPWPSYRSWTNARDLLAACRAAALAFDHPTTLLLLRGCVGDGVAHEFVTYCAQLDLPDPEEVLKHPERLKLPERGDRAYAVLTGVISAVLANNTKERWSRAWDVLAVAVQADRVDVAAGAARALAQNQPAGRVGPHNPAIKAFLPVLKAAGLML